MVSVHAVQVPVVEIVDVIAVPNPLVAARGTVLVRVTRVGLVVVHGSPPLDDTSKVGRGSLHGRADVESLGGPLFCRSANRALPGGLLRTAQVPEEANCERQIHLDEVPGCRGSSNT